MNLEKEIQLFEEWCDIFGLPTDEVDGEYNDPRTAIAFLAWYEVVSREGYKLVLVEPTDVKLKEFQKIWFDSGCAHIMKKKTAFDLYKAMIGEETK